MSIRNFEVKMCDKVISITLTRAAATQLEKRTTPLCVEMELYFSCLIRKKVRIFEQFREQLNADFVVDVSETLSLGFRPVMTKTCSVSSCEGESPPLSDFPIEKPESYIPKWLKMDFKKKEWLGEFGYGA